MIKILPTKKSPERDDFTGKKNGRPAVNSYIDGQMIFDKGTNKEWTVMSTNDIGKTGYSHANV